LNRIENVKSIDSVTIRIEKIAPEMKNTLEIFREEAGTKYTTEFYGTELDVFYNEVDLPKLKIASKEFIIDYYEQASSNNSLLNTIYLLKLCADEKNLNDWGYVQMLRSATSGMFDELNDQYLFAWYALLKTGIDARVGYDEKNIYLFMPCRESIYNAYFFTSQDKTFYLITFGILPGNDGEIYSYEAVYPGPTRDISLKLEELPEIGKQSFDREYIFRNQIITIEVNKSLVDFYNEYPDCDLDILFGAPLSTVAMNSLDTFFKPYFYGMAKTDIVELLLNFVQTAVDYQNDYEQFGRENYLFAEETLFYNNGDCEDRAILLAQLIDRYTGLETIGLDYSQNIQHISLAVNLPETILGDYIELNDDRYYICDPTFIGAKCGMKMSSVKDEVPEIIIY